MESGESESQFSGASNGHAMPTDSSVLPSALPSLLRRLQGDLRSLQGDYPSTRIQDPSASHYVFSVVFCCTVLYGCLKIGRLLKRTIRSEVRCPPGFVCYQCANCQIAQYVRSDLNIFICYSCRVASQVRQGVDFRR